MRTFFRGLGKTCISAGILILLFVAYQLWGTGITEARAQHRLKSEFHAPAVAPPANVPVAAPVPGEAVALLKIAKIGVDVAVVEGVSVDDLKHGPGHYPGTPLPGQKGNSAIAGHRTTYGAPFYRLNELKKGDEILVTTKASPLPWRYVVDSSTEVPPDDTKVLDPTPDNRLTLTTCTPRFTATRRLIVVAELTGPVDPHPVIAPTVPVPLTAGLSGKGESRWPAILWGLVCAAVWGLAWFIGHRWKRWPTYALASPVFLVVLFFFFQNFARFVPANL